MAADASRNESLTLRTPASGGVRPGVLSPAALAFITDLESRFGERRRALLGSRVLRQAAYDRGDLPDFDPATRHLREGDWKVAAIPPVLRDRRVEITGPVDRKMVINALNSGARMFMADFEDSCAPTWSNLIDGQANLRDAVAGTIAFTSPEGKNYRLRDDPAVLMVRPRGWHLDEKHVLRDGRPVSASLFDFGVFAFHNAAALNARELGPFFYLPKIEHWQEAELWEDVFTHTERVLELPLGAMKATVLIETLPAAFQMHEILHALRRRIVALNCGRWDYIFSTIKTVRAHADRVLPERGQVVMTVPFLKAYSELLVRTCHRRGALAMGGMAAQIPINNDPEANEHALAKVRADKLREVTAGHDGTWVAHPGLIPVALKIFDEHMPTSNQLQVTRDDVIAGREDLLAVPTGTITATGYAGNVEVALRYLAAWLAGNGCVPIHHLMEDAATAEIARAQLWQWQRHGARLDDGTLVTAALFDQVLTDVLARLLGEQSAIDFEGAANLLRQLTHSAQLADFITLPAYEQLP